MGLWSDGINRSKDGLDIKDGILMAVLVGKDTVDIRREVKAVSEKAFESNPDAKVNLTYELKESLTKYLRQNLRLLTEAKRYTEFAEFGPMIAVSGCDADTIRMAAEKAVQTVNEINDGTLAEVVEVDIDQVNDIYRQIRERKGEVVEVDGDDITTFMNLPLLGHCPVKQFGQYADYFNRLIKALGSGIFIVTNLNEHNYRDLPHNFIYSLIKHHSFCGIRISPRWLVVLQVGKNVRLDAPGGVPMAFDGSSFIGLSAEEYLQRMRKGNKVVSIEERNMVTKKNHASAAPGKTAATSTDWKGLASEVPEEEGRDWEERHFQICLALLSRSDLPNNNPPAIINHADRMVKALQEKYQGLK